MYDTILDRTKLNVLPRVSWPPFGVSYGNPRIPPYTSPSPPWSVAFFSSARLTTSPAVWWSLRWLLWTHRTGNGRDNTRAHRHTRYTTRTSRRKKNRKRRLHAAPLEEIDERVVGGKSVKNGKSVQVVERSFWTDEINGKPVGHVCRTSNQYALTHTADTPCNRTTGAGGSRDGH